MNPTRSQPERPEPPKGFRLMEQSELTTGCIMPNDALIWEESESPQWEPSCFQGEKLLCRQTGIYATRTAPEAVAGEQYEDLGDLSATPPWHSRRMSCDKCRVTWLGCWDNFQCPKCGEGELPTNDPLTLSAPTPPVEADKDAEIARLREEVDAFVKHVGAPTFAEARDVLLRTKQQDEEKIEAMFNQIKAQGRDLTTVRATIAERDKRIETLVGALEAAPHVAPCLAGTPEYLRIKDYADRGGYACKCWKSALAHAAEGKEQA